MEETIQEIQEALNNFAIKMSPEAIQSRVDMIEGAQEYFPPAKQKALAIKLIHDWEANPHRKIVTASSEICYIKDGPCVTSFGILSKDWPLRSTKSLVLPINHVIQ